MWKLNTCTNLAEKYKIFLNIKVFITANMKNSKSHCKQEVDVRERGDTVQVTMQKPYIKYKIISSSRSWDICYKSFYYGKHEQF
jgi:hypothetical protein